MRRALHGVLAVVLCVSTSACGVIFGGTRQTVNVVSSPPGVGVKIEPAGHMMDYKTPSSISMERKEGYLLTLSMPGYTDAKAEVRKSPRIGILIIDFVFTGIIGLGIDAISGGLYSLSPRDISLSLTKTDASIDGPETITVSLRRGKGKDRNTLFAESSLPGVRVAVE